MAYWIVRQEIEHLDIEVRTGEAARLRVAIETEVGSLYRAKRIHQNMLWRNPPTSLKSLMEVSKGVVTCSTN